MRCRNFAATSASDRRECGVFNVVGFTQAILQPAAYAAHTVPLIHAARYLTAGKHEAIQRRTKCNSLRMRIRALFCLLILNGIQAASAQLVSIGVKGGVSLTEHTTANQDESCPYIVGPSIEFRLPAGFAIEAAALYERLGTSASFRFSK